MLSRRTSRAMRTAIRLLTAPELDGMKIDICSAFSHTKTEVTNHCIMVDILAFVVFSALGSHTPPSDIQAGPLGHPGRPDSQSTV
jgi:hypothetical protein